MEKQALPPIQSFYCQVLKAERESKLSRKEPQIVFLSLAMHAEMENELKELNITFEEFLHKACVDFLQQRRTKKKETEEYVMFNDLRITEDPWKSWSYDDSGASSEPIDLKSSISIPKSNAGSGSDDQIEEYSKKFIANSLKEHLIKGHDKL